MKENILEDSNNDYINDNLLNSPFEKEISNTSISSNDNSDFSNPKKVCYIIILGEIIAILSVGSGEMSNKVSENSTRNFATLLSFIYYLTFGCFWTIFNHGLVKPKFYYFLILFFDVQTSFFRTLALSKGELYYPYIINTSSILFCALLTFIFIKKYKYTWKHFLAIFLCSFGTLLMFYGVIRGKDKDEIMKDIYGFIFALISAICFTFNIVFMEIYFNTGKDIYNFFPYLGIFGTILVTIESIIYFQIIGNTILYNFETDLIHILYALCFMILSLVFGSMVPFYIKRYSASMLNFFMVSQIFWSFIFSLIFQGKGGVSPFFYIGFVIILGSTILFSIFKLKVVPKKNNKDLDATLQNLKIVPTSERGTSL